MRSCKSLSILIPIISGIFFQLSAQPSAITHSTSTRKKDSTFYQKYLAIRKKHPRVDTNTFAGVASTGKKNTYIQKQLDKQFDRSIYHSYWPLLGDSLIFISPDVQKLCVVDQIDSCEALSKKYFIKKSNGDEEYFYASMFFNCGIKALNLVNIDFEKEKGYSKNEEIYVFKFKKGEHYKSITNEYHVSKIVDSIKKVNNYIPLSHTNGVYFNFKKGIVTSKPGGKDTISRFEVENIIYVNNTIRYIEIHCDNHGDDEDDQLYLYSKSGLFSVINVIED